jgi:predicted Zn-ribbon and HTH transcriptional regulator
MKAKDPKVIGIQLALGRTHTGRTIHPDAMKLLDKPHTIEDLRRGFVECSNCGFVLSESVFANGCPNCRSRQDINTGA